MSLSHPKFKKVIFYDHQPLTKGKYKNETSQMALKKLCFIKTLKLTSTREYSCWSACNSPNGLKRIMKLCRKFKTSFDIPPKLFTPLKMACLDNLSVMYPSKTSFTLLKRIDKKRHLSRLNINVTTENYHPKLVKNAIANIKRSPIISKFRLNFQKKPLYIPTEKEISKISQAIGNIKELKTLKLDTNYFAKSYHTKTIFKAISGWNVANLKILIDLRAIPQENLALALSNLASVKSLRSFDMEWTNVETGGITSYMGEIAKAFQVFLKNQAKLNALRFGHPSTQDLCSLAEVYKSIGRLKCLESLSLTPNAGEWKEIDVDSFISSLGGHRHLKRLELHFSELPKTNLEQFYKKLNTGLQSIKKLEKLRLTGTKIPGFSIDDPLGLKDVFRSLLKLEFCLSLQHAKGKSEPSHFTKLIASCEKLEELILGINPTGVTNEKDLSVITTAIGGLSKLVILDFSLGRIKREGLKNIFASALENLQGLYAFRIRLNESYFNDEEIQYLGELLVKKEKLRSVFIAGNYPSISPDLKTWFVSTLRTHGIKTPPLT